MSESVQAEFIVEREEGEPEPEHSIQLTGWEGVVFELEDEGEWPWS